MMVTDLYQPPGTKTRLSVFDHRPSWRWNVFAIVVGFAIAFSISDARVSWITLLAWFAIVYFGELAWKSWRSNRRGE
jgi:hypothetical protein